MIRTYRIPTKYGGSFAYENDFSDVLLADADAHATARTTTGDNSATAQFVE